LQINGSVTDFARWSQAVELAPGWYRLSGEVRAEGVDFQRDSAVIGAYVNGRTFVLPLGAGTAGTGWSAGELYFEVGEAEQKLEIVCVLATSPGKAFFRRIRLTRETQPPPTARRVDLDTVFKKLAERGRRAIPAPFVRPTGYLWSMPLTMALSATLALSGWLTFRRRERSALNSRTI
jgi:hypothetical protein